MPSHLNCRDAFYYSFHYNYTHVVYLSHGNTCRWSCSILGDRLLQYHPAAGWWGSSRFIEHRDTFEQGYRLIHIKQRMGFPAKNIFWWWELYHASPAHFPSATKWYLQFKTNLLQNYSFDSFHIHNTSHLILMNKLPGPINFLYFFSQTTKWFMMYYLFASNVHEILCIYESFPFLCTRESVYFIS